MFVFSVAPPKIADQGDSAPRLVYTLTPRYISDYYFWLRFDMQCVFKGRLRLPPFYGFLFKMVFTRPDPPMTNHGVCFPKFVLVLEISAIKLQIDAITKYWEMGF